MAAAEPGSPDWLADQLNQIWDSKLDVLVRDVANSRAARLAISVAAFLFGVWILSQSKTVDGFFRVEDPLSFAHWHARQYLFAFFLCAGPLFLFPTSLGRQKLTLIVSIAMLIGPLFHPALAGHIEALPLDFLFGLAFPIAMYALLIKTPGFVKVLGMTLTVLVSPFLINALSLTGFATSADPGWWVFHSRSIIMPLSLLMAEAHIGMAAFPPLSSRVLVFLISPINLIFAQPISSQFLKDNANEIELAIRGFADLAVAMIFFAAPTIWSYFTGEGPFVPSANPLLKMLILGYGNYIYYFMVSYAVFRLACGLGRVCGYSLPEPTYFPLLAATPQERWRRWNIYMYDWFFGLFFLPTIRKTSSLAIALFVTFTATLLVHMLTEFVGLAFENVTGAIIEHLRGQTIFFLYHGLLVYLALRTQRFWPSGRTRKGWLSLAATHLLMATAFFIIQ